MIDSIEIPLSGLDLSLAYLRQCPDRMIKEMVISLEKRGQINPVIVAGDSNNSKHLTLVDGFKRYRALEIIDQKTISVIVLPISGAQMKAHLYILNRNNGFSLMEECLLIRELVEKDGMMQKDVGIILEHHKSWISRRLNIIRRLDNQVIEDIRVGLIPSGSSQLLAQLPQCNQVDMSAAIQRDSLKVHEIKRIIELWSKADNPEAKQFVITSSKKALELSKKKSIVKIDPRIPASAGGFYRAVINLKRSATLLKNKSIQNLGTLNSESESILNQAIMDTEVECKQAISGAYRLFRKEG